MDARSYDVGARVACCPGSGTAGWEPLVKIEHYHIGAKQVLEAAK